ncbi:hypothetical protein [Brevundimonas sp.]|uniref:hypothetical protein n=1 Tax=Brevundimonas sp. TaxID=1871086 RepID=UPI002897D3B7|nr:hypothetical protein [Brevundimonas sp.]
MKPVPTAATITLLCAIATWVANSILEARYIGYGVTTSFYTHTAHPLTLLGMQFLTVSALLLCVAALVNLFRKRPRLASGTHSKFDKALFHAAFALAGASAIIALQSVISFQRVFAGLGMLRFELYVPSIMTQIYILGMGLWPAAFVLVTLQIALNRSRNITSA